LKSPALLNAAIKNISKTFYGDLKRFGLGNAPDPLTASISISGNFVEALDTGRVIARPKLAKIIGPNAVQFQDGTTLDGIDVIIMATGYRADYSYRT
jgi:Flavin-binding monooxygenase-like